MNLNHPTLRAFLLLGAALAFNTPQAAHALQLQTVVSSIYQFGNGSGFFLGHTVIASTNYNRLTAGGTFNVTCNSTQTLGVTGERTLYSETYGVGVNQLYVTVPETLPALRNIPGFSSAPRGTQLSCAYRWTSRAVEGGYTIGTGGISFMTGSGERTEGGTREFTMSVPSRGDESGWTSCLP